jgi:PleD family two-component response regulator
MFVSFRSTLQLISKKTSKRDWEWKNITDQVICFWLRILLVEDNLEISEVMAVYCNTQKDIDCKVINRGREGLDRIRDEKFDLILLDLAMPEFSGKVISWMSDNKNVTKERHRWTKAESQYINA